MCMRGLFVCVGGGSLCVVVVSCAGGGCFVWGLFVCVYGRLFVCVERVGYLCVGGGDFLYVCLWELFVCGGCLRVRGRGFCVCVFVCGRGLCV